MRIDVYKRQSKGRMAVVEGRLQIRNWTDKEGNKRRSAEVLADSVYFGDSRQSEGGNALEESFPPEPGQELSEEEDDGELPF